MTTYSELPLLDRATILYRSWHKLDGTVIDTDVAPASNSGDPGLKLCDLEDVKWALTDLLCDPDLEGRHPLVAARFAGSLLLLRAQQGEVIDFHEVVETHMGFRPYLIPETDLDADRESSAALLREQGLRFDHRDEAKFEREFVIPDPERIGAIFATELEQKSKLLADLTGKPRVHIKASTVVEDQPWSGHYGTDERGDPFILFNAHRRHAWTMGKIMSLLWHEPGHAQYFDILRRNIRADTVHPFMGVTTLHTPDQVHIEAVPLITEQVMLWRSGAWEEIFQAVHSRYRHRVYHNAHYRINIQPFTAEAAQQARDYVARRLPFEPPENIESSLRTRRDDSVRRAYYFVYAHALGLAYPLLGKPSKVQDERLKQLYHCLGTETEVAATIAGTS